MRLASAIAVLVLAFAGGARAAAEPPAGEGMARIPAGTYVPFLGERDAKARAGVVDVERTPVAIAAFLLDVHPVTNAEFLEFVKRNPRWSRSRVPALFADPGYLRHWRGDFDLGDLAPARAPVTGVSWFAANAYCRWRGNELPTLDQWEYAAWDQGRNADEIRRRLLAWNSRPNPPSLPPVGSTPPNGYGVADLHGLVWEWVQDFNSLLMTAEARDDGSSDPALFCGGGSFASRDAADYPTFLRYAFRGSLRASYTTANLGFRCSRREEAK